MLEDMSDCWVSVATHTQTIIRHRAIRHRAIRHRFMRRTQCVKNKSQPASSTGLYSSFGGTIHISCTPPMYSSLGGTIHKRCSSQAGNMTLDSTPSATTSQCGDYWLDSRVVWVMAWINVLCVVGMLAFGVNIVLLHSL